MVSVCFVVLHYLSYDETRRCVESLLNLDGMDDGAVVVVDNASGNGSYEKLRATYEGTYSVHFLHHARNEGFARGMNAGYRYAREQLHAKTIGILNNDLVIEQHDFLRQLARECAKGADVIGPDIIEGETGTHVNPQVPPKDYRKELVRYQALRLFFWMVPQRWSFGLLDCLKHDRGSSNIRNRERAEVLSSSEWHGAQLHGAAMFFSNGFVAHERRCLDPRTFLYHEEDLLFQYCMQRGYDVVYTPALRVFHAGEASTKGLRLDARQRKLARLAQQARSVRFVIRSIRKHGRHYPSYWD